MKNSNHKYDWTHKAYSKIKLENKILCKAGLYVCMEKLSTIHNIETTFKIISGQLIQHQNKIIHKCKYGCQSCEYFVLVQNTTSVKIKPIRNTIQCERIVQCAIERWTSKTPQVHVSLSNEYDVDLDEYWYQTTDTLKSSDEFDQQNYLKKI